jgi:hypothetical protein
MITKKRVKKIDAKRAARVIKAYDRLRQHTSVGFGRIEVTSQQIGMALKLSASTLTKHDTAMKVLRQIADQPRRTREQRLAFSCVTFLDSLQTNE